MSRPPLLGLLSVALGGLALAACGESVGGSAGGQSQERQTLLIAAAADLRAAFEEMQPAFEQTCKCTLEFTFGSSGTFARQIEQGLPVDALFSADLGYIDGLDSKGLVVPGTKRQYAVGQIVLAKPRSSLARLTKLEDLLDPKIAKVAIANPDHAPYGVAAREALKAAGVWDAIQPRIVLGENATQTTQYVATANADAGIVPLSLAIQNDDVTYVMIDDSLYSPLRQGAAVLKSSKHPDLARSLIDFIAGGKGRQIMSKYGFLPPTEALP